MSQQFGKIAVEMTVERHSGTYTYRDFNLTNVEVRDHQLELVLVPAGAQLGLVLVLIV